MKKQDYDTAKGIKESLESKEQDKIIFSGRLAEYKYYNMDQIIESVLSKVEKIHS